MFVCSNLNWGISHLIHLGLEFKSAPVMGSTRVGAILAILSPPLSLSIIYGLLFPSLNIGITVNISSALLVLGIESLLVLLRLQFLEAPRYTVSGIELKIRHSLGSSKIPYTKIEYARLDKFESKFLGWNNYRDLYGESTSAKSEIPLLKRQQVKTIDRRMMMLLQAPTNAFMETSNVCVTCQLQAGAGQ